MNMFLKYVNTSDLSNSDFYKEFNKLLVEAEKMNDYTHLDDFVQKKQDELNNCIEVFNNHAKPWQYPQQSRIQNEEKNQMVFGNHLKKPENQQPGSKYQDNGNDVYRNKVYNSQPGVQQLNNGSDNHQNKEQNNINKNKFKKDDCCIIY